jgi:hypothetical protein
MLVFLSATVALPGDPSGDSSLEWVAWAGCWHPATGAGTARPEGTSSVRVAGDTGSGRLRSMMQLIGNSSVKYLVARVSYGVCAQ